MNRTIKSLLGVLIPPAVVFILFFIIIPIDIYSVILLTSFTFLLAWISTNARRKSRPVLTDLGSGAMAEELAGLMKQGQADMQQVLYVAKSVKSKDVADNAMALYRTGEKIMEYLKRNPRKITKARRFFGYYLTTAKDILSKYHEFELTGIKAQEVDDIEAKTSSALVTLQDAFKKQYVSLATNEILDIEADIDLLQKTNKSE